MKKLEWEHTKQNQILSYLIVEIISFRDTVKGSILEMENIYMVSRATGFARDSRMKITRAQEHQRAASFFQCCGRSHALDEQLRAAGCTKMFLR